MCQGKIWWSVGICAGFWGDLIIEVRHQGKHLQTRHAVPAVDDGISGIAFAADVPWEEHEPMIRKLKTGKYRLYSRKVDAKTGKRKNLGTFDTRAAAEKHERAVQFFKRGG